MRALVFLLVLALGCQQQGEDEKLIKSTSPAKSWAASLSYAGQLWLENRVPQSLMKNSVQSSQKAIGKTREQLEKSKASQALKTTVARAIDDLSDSAAALGASVRNHDTKITRREIARCRDVYERLEALGQ